MTEIGRDAEIERLRLIVDAVPLALIVTEADGTLRLANAQAEQLFGYDRGELAGHPVEMLIPERFRAPHPDLRSAYQSAPTTRPMGVGRDLFGLRKDGVEIPIEIGLNPMPSAYGSLVLASIIDITERKHAEALRLANAGVLQHNAQLEALNKELESFSYSVSHDLRAPVRAVSGYAEMLREEYGAVLDGEGRRLLDVVLSEASRMGCLIDDLLELSRLGRQPIEKVPIDTERLVREVIGELRTQSEYDKASIEIAPLPSSYGARAQLRQVWQNLIGNALKYSGNRPDPVVRIRGAVSEGATVFEVSDNGVGFDMKYAGKLFGVFQRLHRAEEFPGTGVGLAIVQRVVTRHGGRAWADGTPGVGATFWFALPTGELHE